MNIDNVIVVNLLIQALGPRKEPVLELLMSTV